MKSGYDQYFKKAQTIAAQKPGQPASRPAKLKASSSRQLAQELRERARPPNQKHVAKVPRKRKSISWKLAGVSLVGVMVAIFGFSNIDQIEKALRHLEVSALGIAYAEEAKPATPAAPAKVDEKKEAAESAVKKDFSPEEINHFSKLNERKRELDAREEELNRMEQELATQKSELDKRLGELETTRKNISSVLEEKVQADDKKVENLVQMYSNMKPQQAAKAFEEMDEGLAIEILGRMKKKSAAEIMNLVKSEKVKVLSEKYAGYKRN